MSKATHRGTCQACGRLQKLPDGRLSTHGYTKRWGFFDGICPGTNHEPFEISKDLIESCIANAQRSVVSIKATRDKLREPAAGPMGFRNEYSEHARGSIWIEVEVVELEAIRGDSGRVYHCFGYKTKNRQGEARVNSLQFYGQDIKTVAEACTSMNKNRADAYGNDLKQLADYIRWQQGRIANWKPEPAKLQPVTK